MSVLRLSPHRLMTGATAGLAAAALVALSAGPGVAAGPVAQATATAFEISIAGQAQDSGSYRVTNDGRTETSSGSNMPAVPIPGALPGSDPTVSVGTLAQDARTQVVRRNGRSAACSGVAGDGATLVAVGEGACLEPGDNLSLGAGSLDLSELLGGGVPSGSLPAPLQDALDDILGGLPGLPGGGQGPADQVDAVIMQVLAALGDPSLTLDLGAIQSACVASAPSNAEGDSLLTDVSLDASFMGQDLTLIELPSSVPPNTAVPTQSDVLVGAINDALRTQLTQGLGGATGPLTGLNDVIDQINDAVIAQIAPQLAPLEDNLLRGTINKQTTSPGAIDVTALELEVLPAAQDFIDDSLVRVALANVTCGPSGRVMPPSNPPTTTVPDGGTPAVPTFVPAGQDSTAAARTDDGSLNDTLALVALGGLAVVAGAAGVATYRRAAR